MQAELNREGKCWKAAGDGNIKGRRRIKRSVIDERKRYRTVLFRGNQLEQYDIRYLIREDVFDKAIPFPFLAGTWRL